MRKVGDIICFEYYGGHTPAGGRIRVVEIKEFKYDMAGHEIAIIASELTDENKIKTFNYVSMKNVNNVEEVHLGGYSSLAAAVGRLSKEDAIKVWKIINPDALCIYCDNSIATFYEVKYAKKVPVSGEFTPSARILKVGDKEVTLTAEQAKQLGLA